MLPAALAAQSTESITSAVASITPEDVAHRIGVIAHDSMRGRDTPSPELDEVAEYIAAEFERFGLRPGGDDGGFIQRYPIRSMAIIAEQSTVRFGSGESWALGPDVLFRDGVVSRAVSGKPYLVSGGQGDVEALKDIPAGSTIFLVVGASPFVRQLFQAAFSRSPAALFWIGQRSDASWNRAEAMMNRPRAQVGSRSFVLLEVRDAAVATLLTANGYDPSLASFDAERPLTVRHLDRIDVTLDLQYVTVQEESAPNVVGILEGSDPVLKHEYLVYSAHMDHDGVKAPVNGDSIWNGADDDASGTIAVVEAAEAFAKLEPRPKRSIIFLTVSGEEKGMWGSTFFAESPPVPMEQIVANFNADMVGRNWRDTIVVIGRHHSDLGETLGRVNAEHPELNMTAIDDLWPEENFYGRSDHINFARRGVPILFFFNGTHEDYHRPSDEPEKIDAEKESRIVKLLFYLGLEVANAAERPKWNPESAAEIVSGGR
jgi:hypothetical protein